MLLAAIALVTTAHGQTPIACCDHPGVQTAVAAVADVAAAVAKDPNGGSKELAAIAALEVDRELSAADRDELNGLKRAARAQSVHANGAERVLPYLTRHAVFLALRHEGGDLVVAEGWCADEQRGWLQTDLEKLHRPWKDCGNWR